MPKERYQIDVFLHLLLSSRFMFGFLLDFDLRPFPVGPAHFRLSGVLYKMQCFGSPQFVQQTASQACFTRSNFRFVVKLRC